MAAVSRGVKQRCVGIVRRSRHRETMWRIHHRVMARLDASGDPFLLDARFDDVSYADVLRPPRPDA